MGKQENEGFSYIVAIIISSICLLFIVFHAICFYSVDNITIILLLIGLAPWLTKFFTKIKFGDIEAHSGKRSQGSTDKPSPPAENLSQATILPVGSLSVLTSDAKRILGTLWKYQKLTFKEDFSKRWTFGLYPNSLKYYEYIYGLSELLKVGLISIASDTGQCMLTNEGVSFVQQHNELQNYSDIYTF